MGPKIATCCYCGTRAALVIERARHELSCSSCGAPLREMKSMPCVRGHDTPERSQPAKNTAPRPAKAPAKSKKKRKSLKRRILEEVWDAVEDIFD